ncbi:TetR/AcrR family transcriptional regulator [Mucilaginibacter ginsenosidivorans]|uniref:TetR/AcrR family transcriptional regulator n=2 Tax=Mucilaginibacter ginsenosidivorans TaxID=398053 RepID=A0A5B8UU44_9SPHI|nr:TetR/AcrR family transcriptional regulator [Mucilaginibacter ginsenosidivorans]
MHRKNKDETMKRLIEAVGQILKDKGYTGLGVNKIAFQAGVSKELIYRYFDSLNNLLKAYISGKDYWQPLLTELSVAAIEKPPDMLQLFVTLLQDQFRFFYEEKEMQKFILWQISELNVLMRSISENRESEGAKLLNLTDEHFRDSGINFRPIVALLLGGIYYVILHAENNRSTVAGVDANLEKDREELLIAIEQILTWAWEKAAENKNK